MFGDNKAYVDKFKTAARTRPLEKQRLGSEFHEKEHTKPLFKKNRILTVHNLYKFTCLMEMFKINRLESPNSLLNLFQISSRRSDYFTTPTPSSSFIYQSSNIWNSCRKTSSEISFTASTNVVKSRLKNALIEVQCRYDESQWCELNFDLKELKFWSCKHLESQKEAVVGVNHWTESCVNCLHTVHIVCVHSLSCWGVGEGVYETSLETDE